MHHPIDRIVHTTAFVTPVVVHWLEREIAQWIHCEGSIWRPIAPWANVLSTELHLAPWRIETTWRWYLLTYRGSCTSRWLWTGGVNNGTAHILLRLLLGDGYRKLRKCVEYVIKYYYCPVILQCLDWPHMTQLANTDSWRVLGICWKSGIFFYVCGGKFASYKIKKWGGGGHTYSPDIKFTVTHSIL